MSSNVEINGVTLVPIKEAAKIASYSRDYVTRLAREKKIVATQIGQQWFIDIISLKSFVEASALEQTVRQQQLSLERKREQTMKEETEKIKKSFKGRRHDIRFQAQLVSCLALTFGLLVGTSLYTISSLTSEKNFHIVGIKFGPTLIDSDSPEFGLSQNIEDNLILTQATPQVVTVLSDVSDKPVFVDESKVTELSKVDTQGIFLLPQNGQMQDINQVREMFSDDLSIEYIDDGAGVIVYVRESGERVEFPFVSVPLLEQTDAKAENI